MSTSELHLPEPDPDNWVLLEKTGGIRVNTLWEDAETGARIALLDIPEGAGTTPQRRWVASATHRPDRGDATSRRRPGR